MKGCHLYRLLRPELVKKNAVPLSSDAFTYAHSNIYSKLSVCSVFAVATFLFITLFFSLSHRQFQTLNQEEHNQEVREATDYLVNTVVRKFGMSHSVLIVVAVVTVTVISLLWLIGTSLYCLFLLLLVLLLLLL